MNCFRFVVQSELHSTHASADQTGTSTTSGLEEKEKRLNSFSAGTARIYPSGRESAKKKEQKNWVDERSCKSKSLKLYESSYVHILYLII